MTKPVLIKSGGVIIQLNGATPAIIGLFQEQFGGYFRIIETAANTEPSIIFKIIESSSTELVSLIAGSNTRIKMTHVFHDHDTPEIWVVLAQAVNEAATLELHFSSSTPGICIMILRVIRAIILQLHFSQGKTFIHASAVSIKGKVLAFTGQKHAGKTTCLLAMCKYTSALPMTNDKMSVGYEGSYLRAQGFPIKAGIRKGSLDIIDQDRFFSTNRVHYPNSDKVIRVTMQELARKFTKSTAHSGRLTAVCIPVYDSDAEVFSVRQYHPLEIKNIWKENLLKSLAEIDPEQKAIEYFFPIQCESNLIPEIPFFECRSNSNSIKAMVEHLEQLTQSL